MNELEKRKRLNFESKTYLIEDLSKALMHLNKTTQQVMKRLNEGVSNDEFIKALLFIGFNIDKLNKYLDATVVITDKETGIKHTVLIKTLNKEFVNSIAIDISEMIKELFKDFNQEKLDDYVDKFLNNFNELNKNFHEVFEEYKKEAVELGYTTQKIINEVDKKYGIAKDI